MLQYCHANDWDPIMGFNENRVPLRFRQIFLVTRVKRTSQRSTTLTHQFAKELIVGRIGNHETPRPNIEHRLAVGWKQFPVQTIEVGAFSCSRLWRCLLATGSATITTTVICHQLTLGRCKIVWIANQQATSRPMVVHRFSVNGKLGTTNISAAQNRAFPITGIGLAGRH